MRVVLANLNTRLSSKKNVKYLLNFQVLKLQYMIKFMHVAWKCNTEEGILS